MNKLLSRKLLASVGGMAAIVGLIVGVGVIDKQLLIDAKELLAGAILAIAGLGGYVVTKQAEIDSNKGGGE